MRCKYCDGILGKDCFNERECGVITNNLDDFYYKIGELQNEIDMLRDWIKMHNLPLPTMCEVIDNLKEDREQELPF